MRRDRSQSRFLLALVSALSLWLLLSGSHLHAEATASAASSRVYEALSKPISPLGPGDYAEYQASLAVLRAKIEFYRDNSRQAVSENSTIKDELEKLRLELEQHSSESTTSYEQQQQTIQRLTERLQSSDSLVSELQSNLESKVAEYLALLTKAEASAARLERKNRGLKVVVGILAAIAAALGIVAVVK